MLVPPDNFGLVETGVYRCSKLEPDHFPFIETLNLKTILLLDAENSPRPLKIFISENNINLINLGGLKVTNHNHTGANDNTSSNMDQNGKSNDKSSNSWEVPSPLLSQSPKDSSGSRYHSNNIVEINMQLINLNNTTKKNDQWMLIERNLIRKAFEYLLNRSKYNILIVDGTSTLVSILRRIQKWNFNSIVNEFRIYSGNSAKSNYFAENFLELIEIELVAFEVDEVQQLLKLQKEEQQKLQVQQQPQLQTSLYKENVFPEISRTMSWHKNSIDDESLWDKEMDEEDFDEDLLSASPQIPENLLKLVEKKRQNLLELSDDELSKLITPGTSPRFISSIPNNGSRLAYLSEIRRRSVDSKFMRPINDLFRSPLSNSLTPRHSGDNLNGSRRSSKIDRAISIKSEELNEDDEKRIREKYDFKYYKILSKPTDSASLGTIKLKLPPNNKLPNWFTRGRDFWEDNYNKLNTNI